jgi:glutamate-ammonia-ligase adenylyltransferase
LRHLTDFASPRRALPEMWRLLAEHRPLVKLLISLFGTSEFLARRFVAHPELLDQLLLAGRSAPRRTSAELTAELSSRLTDPGDFESDLRALRRFKQEEELRIGMHAIAGELDDDEVGDQLSALAEVVVRAALAICLPAPRTPLCVLALGRLGAGELGFGSDLDLIFVHGGSELEDHERTARIAQRLIRALTAYLEEGRLYDIDTRLRPSGRDGLLVTTLPALSAYHQGEARLWERQALIKARVVAGDAELGLGIERERQRIVYDAPLPASAAAEMARLRARIENELASEGPESYNPKLGAGGVVDIEFIVQLQQLRHGRAHVAARARKDIDALAALAQAGLCDPGTAAVLRDGYRFLRRLENRLRIVNDRPVDLLHTSQPAELDKLARRMGYRGDADPPGAQLVKDYKQVTGSVRAIYDRTFSAHAAHHPDY